MSHGVECKTTNQKTRVRNFTKKKENRTALQYNKLWITRGILVSIKNKQKLCQSHFLNGIL